MHPDIVLRNAISALVETDSETQWLAKTLAQELESRCGFPLSVMGGASGVIIVFPPNRYKSKQAYTISISIYKDPLGEPHDPS